MKEDFLELYNIIVTSNDENKMRILGHVTKSMMMRMIDNYPQIAKEYLDMLQAVLWNNYLTSKEAEQIISNMIPKPLWNHSNWETMIANMGLSLEQKPFYNKEALYVTMSMICSDSSQTILDIMRVNDLANENKDIFFRAVYQLALDKLTDKDKMFNIRNYFKL